MLKSTPIQTPLVETNPLSSEIPQRSGSSQSLLQPSLLLTCMSSQLGPQTSISSEQLSRAFSASTTFMLVTTNSSSLGLWTTFLGLTSAAFSAIQYLPQIQKTWNLKLVGSLSITTMCIQSPGAVLMCLSIGIRYVGNIQTLLYR